MLAELAPTEFQLIYLTAEKLGKSAPHPLGIRPLGGMAGGALQRTGGGLLGACGPYKRSWLPPAVLLVFWQLAGCAGAPVMPTATDFWIKGKIGVVEGGEAFSARFAWAGHRQGFTIDLWGPLGQGRTRLRAFGLPNEDHPQPRREGTQSAKADACSAREAQRRLEILDGAGEVFASGCAQALMLEHLGWSLPLDLFLEWINGRPSPRTAATDLTRDAQDRLVAFRQLGWRVRYDGLGPPAAGGLPARITAEKPGSTVRVSVSERRGWGPAAGGR